MQRSRRHHGDTKPTKKCRKKLYRLPTFSCPSVIVFPFRVFRSLFAPMALADFLAELDLCSRCRRRVRGGRRRRRAGSGASSIPRRESGRLKTVQKGLGTVDKTDKPAAGKRFNEVKQAIEAATNRPSSGWPRPRPAAVARRSIPRCPASACGWAGCTRSPRRSTS